MKNKFQYKATIIVLFLSAGFSNQLFSQDNKEVSNVKEQVENKQFTFVATSVSPLRGRTRFLSDFSNVRINKDSLISDLPYFGVAQTAPMSTDDAGIKFTSTNFKTITEQGKKNSWDIQLNFSDQTTTRQFHFIIYDDGTAILDVTSNFRDPISFKGYLKN